jgi:predicted DCC family thiol-disulfide oxidoreductase YuxK
MATLPTLVFDGDCAFCTRCVRWMERRLPRQPRVIAWQVADLGALGLTAQQCTDAVQWVEDGRSAAGADGIARLLIWTGGFWPALGRVMLLPGVIHAARLSYRWVARNRDKMPGGTAACAVPPRDTDTAA